MELMATIKSFILQSVRVWRILKKPSMQELASVAKISALGILAIGAIGFAITSIVRLLT